ncbi:tripartite tricarboxylate transporter TctB family protein [Halomonas sp. SpR1]|uniref:tripartite tricarboxylate transporter TctB family protein n=1 Tax=unclassified Halomonas TaxID=2609666 RepID=UPI000B0BD11A|nr:MULTISPECIES: tripartite tricarboxylate transporter TctB family protein [unclassified Halomonas]MDQ7735096.1 tripartite tricarboxylate transporter TctB family protein [Halomonas sp. SpR1]
MNFRDIISGVAFLILGCTVVWVGNGFDAGAAYVPMGVGMLMCLFSLPLIFKGVRQTLGASESSSIATPLIDHPGRFMATVACCLIYYLAMPTVGFYSTSTLFIILLALVLGERRPSVVIGITVGFIILLYGLFAIVLKRPLPVEFFLVS